MERALIIGDTGGIGSAIARELASRSVEVIGLSRKDGLSFDSEVSIRTAAGRLTCCFDLILVATGTLEANGSRPEKRIADMTPESLSALFVVNAVGPAMIVKHYTKLLSPTGVMAAMSARVGSIGDNNLGGWISYRTSKAALNQIIRTASIEVQRTLPNAKIIALHPGTVRTSLTEKYVGSHPAVSPDVAAKNILAVIEGLSDQQTGVFLDWQGRQVPW
jgi:NAD(P)-dependent dehydrogenase (short-subunit alcohol dehydrogenase family)